MKPYAILRPVFPPPRQPEIKIYSEVTDEIIDAIDQASLVAVDFETVGLQPYAESFRLRSIGLHSDSFSFCIDFNQELKYELDDSVIELLQLLAKKTIIAHNYFFEGSIFRRYATQPVAFHCTRHMFKLLASEGWLGQNWGLKTAMVDLLGWDLNNVELDAWLKANKMTKDKMSYAPREILCPYNQLDAAATWELYHLFMDTINQYDWGPHFLDYLVEGNAEYRHLVEINHAGLPVDMDYLRNYQGTVDASIDYGAKAFLTHPDIAPHIEFYNAEILRELVEARPPEFTKDGKVTARYTKWLEKCRQYQQVQHFNLDSNSHLKWLFFDRMRLPVLERTEKGEPSVGKKTLNKMGGVAKILLEYRSQRDVRKFLTSLEENQIDGKFRPSYKVVGTVSSRLSCGDA